MRAHNTISMSMKGNRARNQLQHAKLSTTNKVVIEKRCHHWENYLIFMEVVCSHQPQAVTSNSMHYITMKTYKKKKNLVNIYS